MPHPRMYEDDDPHLDDVRRVCLSLPEAVEVEAWGRPTFRAGKGKMFAVFEGSDEHPYALVFKPEPEERPALLQDERFSVPKYHGPYGWLSVSLTAQKPDWTEIQELVTGSYRQVANQRQLRALDADGSPRTDDPRSPGGRCSTTASLGARQSASTRPNLPDRAAHRS